MLSSLSRAARRFASSSSEPLQRTALHGLQVSLGGKMVPFAGYEMAVQFEGKGVLAEHLHCRAAGNAALWDVGHMGQIRWTGRDRVAFLETVVVADVAALAEGASALTVVTTPEGTILDDSIVSNHGKDTHFMVVNGATKHGDLAHFQRALEAFRRARPGADVTLEHLEGRNLVAVQGPGAARAVASLLDGAQTARDAFLKTPFMHARPGVTLAGIRGLTATRCGYTGEDGFEISVGADAAVALTQALLAVDGVAMAGLGARDSLRLEAGLCLYGHDMDTGATPNEASLSWVIPKSRREPGSARANFTGAGVILAELRDKSWKKRRVGLRVRGAPAREGAKIFAHAPAGSPAPAADKAVGVITSGTFSPILKAPVAMGYVPPALSADGKLVSIDVRGKLVDAEVSKMPFVPTRYFRG